MLFAILSKRIEKIGDEWLTWLLLFAALAIVVVALFSKNTFYKAVVAAYVLLP